MVWFAPVPCISAGLSAVRSMSGTPDSLASTTAGSKFATAVPEVVITAAGTPFAFPRPSAKNPSDLSSMQVTTSALGWFAAASTSGVDLLPGAMQKYFTPSLQSSSTTRKETRAFVFGKLSSGAIFCRTICVNCWTFRSSSFHSRAGLDPSTIPTPAYIISSFPSSLLRVSADRMATANSELCPEIQPKGPE